MFVRPNRHPKFFGSALKMKLVPIWSAIDQFHILVGWTWSEHLLRMKVIDDDDDDDDDESWLFHVSSLFMWFVCPKTWEKKQFP